MTNKTKELLEILDLTKHGLAKKEIVKHTGSYLLTKGSLHTFNDDVSISCPIPWNIEGAVKADLLYSIVKAVPDSHVDITIEGSRLNIESSSVKASVEIDSDPVTLQTIQDDLTPKFNDCQMTDVPSNFPGMLKIVMTSVSKNMARPALCCINCNDNLLESTDNYSITQCILDKNLTLSCPILIPRTSVETILKFTPLAVCIVDDWLHIKTAENATVSCRTSDHTFPAIDQYLHLDYKPIEFPLEDLKRMLKRANMIASKDFYGRKMGLLTVRDGRLAVRVKEEKGEFEESCSIGSHDTLSLLLNIDFLNQIMKQPINSVAGLVRASDTTGFLRFTGHNFTHVQIINLL